jgi:hypothetical protein
VALACPQGELSQLEPEGEKGAQDLSPCMPVRSCKSSEASVGKQELPGGQQDFSGMHLSSFLPHPAGAHSLELCSLLCPWIPSSPLPPTQLGLCPLSPIMQAPYQPPGLQLSLPQAPYFMRSSSQCIPVMKWVGGRQVLGPCLAQASE